MKIRPSIVISDLEEYLGIYGVSLSKEARKTLIEVEEFAHSCDNPAGYKLIFSKVIRNSPIIQNILISNGLNPDLIALTLEQDYYNGIDELSNYEKQAYSYSKIHNRSLCEKAAIIDKAIKYSIGENRNMIKNYDILLAAMDDFEIMLDKNNGHWVDNRLNKDVTIAHVCGCYDQNLWIKFDDLRKALLKTKQEDQHMKIA